MNASKYRIFSRLAAMCVLAFAAFPVNASVSFDGLDLSSDDRLLFSAKHSVPGTPDYSTLFAASLGKTSVESLPQILTCFPERMELLNGGSLLQLRNRYGTARYSVGDAKLKWISTAQKMPVEYIRTGAVSVSPDGKWLCYVNQTKNAAGQLVLQNALTLEQKVLVENASLNYDHVAVKWAPDSNVVLYEKNGSVYFITPGAAFKNVQLPEDYRKIGKGTIQSVVWSSGGELFYIDNDIIYRIRENELYTRGLYSALVGSGTIEGRLPNSFDPLHDNFYMSPDGLQLVVINSQKTVGWYSFSQSGYDYVKTLGVFPLTGIKGAPLEYYVFWTQDRKPVLWLSLLNYGTGRKSSSVYRLNKNVELVLDIMGASKPAASPDGKHVAFSGGSSLYVYDVTTWKQSARLTGENYVSFLWATSSSLYAGGSETVSFWQLDYKTPAQSTGTNATNGNVKVLFLSSVEHGRWDGNRITAQSVDGKSFYAYDSERNAWTSIKKLSLFDSPASEKNGRFRVFTGTTQNKRYTNAVYVRSLSGTVITYPVYPECEESVSSPKRAALIFDAMDSAEGLARILYVLDDFGVKGTFFLNGEFIRRYPVETNQIVASGAECASSFYSTADLTSGNFVIDADFIKRGLARNEDEFFSATSKELSLLWHAPWYKSSPLMESAGSAAGYRYVNAFTLYNDRVNFEESTRHGSDVVYMDAGQLIDAIVMNLKDGMIIPVSVGKVSGTRQDYLYEKADLLVAAILDAGYEIVSVRDLVNE